MDILLLCCTQTHKRSFLKGFLWAEFDTLSENFHTVTLNPLVCIPLWVDHSPMQDFTSLCLFSRTIAASELGRSSKYWHIYSHNFKSSLFVTSATHLVRKVFKGYEAVRLTVEGTDFPNSEFCPKAQFLWVYLEVTGSFCSDYVWSAQFWITIVCLWAVLLVRMVLLSAGRRQFNSQPSDHTWLTSGWPWPFIWQQRCFLCFTPFHHRILKARILKGQVKM